ncbi:P-loop containing nucleoside triphosphate hydrolase protein, partial [Daedalea quercina L-15889]
VPSLEEVRAKTSDVFQRHPCSWQAEAVQQAVKGDNDVVLIAPTGSGKTLTFWMPLLFREDGIQIVVTPLNLLGSQNVSELKEYGIPACDDIGEGRYRAIIANPEELMKDGGGFEKLWKKEAFTSRIISIVWDEAHCISTWSSFCTDYKNAYRIRYLLPKTPFFLASATFNDHVKEDVFKTLHM